MVRADPGAGVCPAELVGPCGIGFLLVFCPAAVPSGRPRRDWRVAAVGVLATALVLCFGTIRLAIPQPAPRVRVGLMASDQPRSGGTADEGAPTTTLFRD